MEAQTSHKTRLLLERELARRIRQNPSYSLRAFARALGVSHSLLSLVLAEKRKASALLAMRVATRVGVSGPAALPFLMPFPEDSPTEHQLLALDEFALLSDWYHYAILSLLDTPKTKFNAPWIARKLGISRTQAASAMRRLRRMKLVGRVKGHWKQIALPLKVENSVSTVATRSFHKQLLKKATESLENHPIEVRDFSSVTFAMDPQLVEHAKLRIRHFRRQLMRELESMGPRKTVYNLTVQIFPVSTFSEDK